MKVLVTGGYPSASARTPLATAEMLDPAADRWISAASTTTHRAGHTATLLADGKVLVAGSSGALGPLASAEIFDSAAVGESSPPSPVLSALPQSTLALAGLAAALGIIAILAVRIRRQPSK
jgi:hypothetical protein